MQYRNAAKAGAIGGAVQVVGSSLAFSLGLGASSYLGAVIPAAISGYAIGGTTLGALGVMACGTVFAIGFAVAAGAYVNHFSSKGVAIANTELKSALELLNGGQIDLTTYVGKVGKLSELTFNWSDMLPLSGAISVISEYGVRKNQLRAVQSSIYAQLNALPEQEREMMQDLALQYEDAITTIDLQYETARASITEQAFDQFDAMSKDLNQHLEMQYLMFTSVRKTYIEHTELMDVELRKQQQDQQRSEAFADELEELQNKIKKLVISDQIDATIQNTMQQTILTRMEILIPHRTGWDQACEFLEMQ